MKKLLSLVMVLCIAMCSLVFADNDVYYASSAKGLTSSGYIISKRQIANGTETQSQVIENTTSNTTETTTEDPNRSQLDALYARLAELRSGNSTTTSTPQTTTIQAADIASGYKSNGVAYGLARLAQVLSVKRGEVNFVSAEKTGDYSYKVKLSSADAYANGLFQVDVYDATIDGIAEGYQLYFGLYDVNGNKIGTCEAKKIWS